MQRWVALTILAVVCVVAGAATAWPLLAHLGYALAAIVSLAAGIAWASVQRLEITRGAIPAAVMVDEVIPVSYRIRKAGLLPAFGLLMDDEDGERDYRLAVRGRSEHSLTLQRSMSRRGRYEVGAVGVFGEDPFGIFRFHSASLSPEPITVYPRPIPVSAAALPASSTRASHHRWHRDDADATLGDLRPYRPGDPPSRVHWRSTARSGTLIVTDPETHRPLTVWLLVDLGGETDGERSPGIAAYLTQQIINLGLSLGAVVVGQEIVTIRAGRGSQQQFSILDALATVPSSRRSQLDRLAHLASRLDHAGKLLVVSSASLSDESSRSLRRACPDVVYVSATAGAPVLRL